MALVDVVYSAEDDVVRVVPFAYNRAFGGGNIASGATIEMSIDEFVCRAKEILSDCIKSFSKRDSALQSEFYDEIPPTERRRILCRSIVAHIGVREGSDSVKVYVEGDDAGPYQLRYPFEEGAGAEIVAVLRKLSHCTGAEKGL